MVFYLHGVQVCFIRVFGGFFLRLQKSWAMMATGNGTSTKGLLLRPGWLYGFLEFIVLCFSLHGLCYDSYKNRV
jgi:hypothetical protein